MATNLDYLDTPVREIDTQILVDLPTAFEPMLFFDGDRFMRYLNKNFFFFDVATYSISRSKFDAPLLRIRRLITALPLQGPVAPDEHKLVINNHTKIFLCYKKGRLRAAYIGSQNLTHGTNLNLMYLVRPRHLKCVADFFETLWRAK